MLCLDLRGLMLSGPLHDAGGVGRRVSNEKWVALSRG